MQAEQNTVLLFFFFLKLCAIFRADLGKGPSGGGAEQALTAAHPPSSNVPSVRHHSLVPRGLVNLCDNYYYVADYKKVSLTMSRHGQWYQPRCEFS